MQPHQFNALRIQQLPEHVLKVPIKKTVTKEDEQRERLNKNEHNKRDD